MPIHHGVPDGWDDDWAKTQNREAAVGMSSRPTKKAPKHLRGVRIATGAIAAGQPLCNDCLARLGFFQYNIEDFTPLFRGDQWRERTGGDSYQMHPYYCGGCTTEFT